MTAHFFLQNSVKTNKSHLILKRVKELGNIRSYPIKMFLSSENACRMSHSTIKQHNVRYANTLIFHVALIPQFLFTFSRDFEQQEQQTM